MNWLTAGSDAVDWVPTYIERYPAAYLLEMEDFAEAVLHDRSVAVGGEDGLAASRYAWPPSAPSTKGDRSTSSTSRPRTGICTQRISVTDVVRTTAAARRDRPAPVVA